MITIDGQTYTALIGSDLKRDGMFLEVQDGTNALVARIFYFDRDCSMTFTAYRPNVPLPLVEWMIAHGKQRLAPTT